MRRVLSAFCCMALLTIVACGKGEVPPEKASQDMLYARGSLGFWFHIDEAYFNGVEPQGDLMTMVEVPGIFLIDLDAPSIEAAAAAAAYAAGEKTQEKVEKKPPSSIVNLQMRWLMEGGNTFWYQVPLLPGPNWYYIAYRWDSNSGLFDGYINGTPMRGVGANVGSWPLTDQQVTFQIDDLVEDFEISNEIWTEEMIQNRLTKHPNIDMGPLTGFGEKQPMELVEPLKGKLIYAPDFSKKTTFDTWKMEGPGNFEIDAEGWLSMESTKPDEGGPGDNHIVFWLPQEFPSDFVAEWDFQALTTEGLVITLFAAMGQNGENVLNPSLKPRDGRFGGYIRGDINCYHTSYYANAPTNPGRNTCNMRKNYGFYLVSNGPSGVPNGSKDIHKVTLVKNNNRIRLGVDDMTIIDWTDDGVQYGTPLDGGSMGWRQMKWMKARYRNLKVWEVTN